jgi:hypothetical protein
VGEHLMNEVPEVYWEDAHAVFRFETEQEALEAVKRMKMQLNLPRIDWDSMTVTQVKSYRPYSSDVTVLWTVIDKVSTAGNPLQMHREKGEWHVAFGKFRECVSLSAPAAICVAALLTIGVEVDLDRDRVH